MKAATILVVDDEEQILSLAELILQAEGYQVYTAGSAAEALTVADELECRLNLLLTDVNMPGTDGVDLVLAIGKLCPYMDTIFMSGDFLPEDARFKSYKLLPKPFSADQLLGAVKEMLGGQIP